MQGFLTLEGEQSMQVFWKTCRELYRRTTLTETQTQEMTDQVLDEAMWEETRPWEDQWESLKVNESKIVEQELDDEDRQARFWRYRTDGFVVNEKEHIIYNLEFKTRSLGRGSGVCVRDPETSRGSTPCFNTRS
jgi:hypothetical protein